MKQRPANNNANGKKVIITECEEYQRKTANISVTLISVAEVDEASGRKGNEGDNSTKRLLYVYIYEMELPTQSTGNRDSNTRTHTNICSRAAGGLHGIQML
jgi:hypothetical protein